MYPAPSALDRPFSIYLDLVRFLAALAVVVMHVRQGELVRGANADLLTMLGREAVMAFFVLSGFVIAYTSDTRRPSVRDFAVARCARIYSVALPVLVLAFVVTWLLAPHLDHRIDKAYQLAKPWLYLPFHLQFLGDLWQLSEVPPLLVPWWSLNYEVWYYVLFGVACYLRGARRVAAIALVLAIMGIKLWLLLPVWLAGVWLYRWQASHVLPRALARAGFGASLALLVIYEAGDLETTLRDMGRASWLGQAFSLGNADRFLADYVVGLIVCLNFACARFAGFGAMLRVAAPVRRCASYTLTLYLSHALVLAAWPVLYSHDPANPLDLLALGAAIGLAAWLLGAVTEQRKDAWRRLFERIFDWFFGPQPMSASAPAALAAASPHPIKEQQQGETR